MIARVIPALRMPRDVSYDYHVPKNCPTPAVGALVRIRVHGRSATGLVVEIRERSLVSESRLKDMDAVFAGGVAVISEEMIALLPRLALQYCVSLPLLLRNLLPTLPVRKDLPLPLALADGTVAEKDPKFSVVQMQSLFDPAAVRSVLAPLLAMPTLILAPTKTHAAWLAETLADFAPALYDGSASISTGARSWAALLDGQHHLLITTRSGVLAPTPARSRIILFNEEDASYQQFDAEPQYDSRVILRARCHAEKKSLFAFAEAPSLAMIHAAQMRTCAPAEEAPVVVSLTDERRAGFRGVFSDTAVSEIRDALENKRDVLVCVNRKGTALTLRCGDCYAAVSCPTCGLPMRVFSGAVSCNHCQTTHALPEQCPGCGSQRLRGRGLTVDTAMKTLTALFPQTSVVAPSTPAALRQAQGPCLLLGTEMLIHSLRAGVEQRSIGAVVVPSAEQLFGIGYRDSEDGYATLRALQAIAERHRAALILQTYDPAHPVFQALGGDPAVWYDMLLAERKTFRYPPTYLWIRLSVPKEQTEEAVREQLVPLLPPFATVDVIGKNVYSLKFENSAELIPDSFRQLPATWHWRVNPRA